mgnify:CR=1 FL=1
MVTRRTLEKWKSWDFFATYRSMPPKRPERWWLRQDSAFLNKKYLVSILAANVASKNAHCTALNNPPRECESTNPNILPLKTFNKTCRPWHSAGTFECTHIFWRLCVQYACAHTSKLVRPYLVYLPRTQG